MVGINPDSQLEEKTKAKLRNVFSILIEELRWESFNDGCREITTI
jgi:hypothetical protein